MKTRLWLARLLILIVVAWNLQAAIFLILNNDSTAIYLGLPGQPGRVVLLGTAVLFLMWNVPYIIAALHPIQHRISLLEAIVMQVIGLAGEAAILLSLDALPVEIDQALMTYIRFDLAGLVLLVAAAWTAQLYPFRTRSAL